MGGDWTLVGGDCALVGGDRRMDGQWGIAGEDWLMRWKITEAESAEFIVDIGVVGKVELGSLACRVWLGVAIFCLSSSATVESTLESCVVSSLLSSETITEASGCLFTSSTAARALLSAAVEHSFSFSTSSLAFTSMQSLFFTLSSLPAHSASFASLLTSASLSPTGASLSLSLAV